MEWYEKVGLFRRNWGDTRYFRVDIFRDTPEDIWDKWLSEFGHEYVDGEWDWMSLRVVEDYFQDELDQLVG